MCNVWTCVFTTLGYLPKSGIFGSHDNFMFYEEPPDSYPGVWSAYSVVGSGLGALPAWSHSTPQRLSEVGDCYHPHILVN